MPQLKETEFLFQAPKFETPDWQMRFFANYEYARESDQFKLRVESIRANQIGRGYASGECWRLLDFAAQFLPEFPNDPWLEIPINRRVELLAKILIREQAGDEKESVQYFGEPLKYAGDVLLGKMSDMAPLMHTFRIDFREHRTRIIQSFERWLSSEIEKRSVKPTVNRRGRALNVSKWRDILNSLGSFRRERAGQRVFENASSSSRNKTKVNKLIQAFECRMTHARFIL